MHGTLVGVHATGRVGVPAAGLALPAAWMGGVSGAVMGVSGAVMGVSGAVMGVPGAAGRMYLWLWLGIVPAAGVVIQVPVL